MYLQSLKEYYDQRVKDPDSGMPLYGFSSIRAGTIIELNKNGHIHNLIVIPKDSAKLNLPSVKCQRTGNIKAYISWDYKKYILGTSIDDNGKVVNFPEHFQNFREVNKKYIKPKCPLTKAFIKFLGLSWETIAQECNKIDPNFVFNNAIVFKLNGEESYLHDVISSEWEQIRNDYEPEVNTEKVQSMVDGSMVIPTNNHGHILIRGKKGPFLSFNMNCSESYGRLDGFISPMSEEQSFKIVQAINHMGSSRSNHVVMDKNCEIVLLFWSEKMLKEVEDVFSSEILNGYQDEDEKLSVFIKKYKKGVLSSVDLQSKFYTMLLRYTDHRFMVCEFTENSVEAFINNLEKYYENLKLVHRGKILVPTIIDLALILSYGKGTGVLQNDLMMLFNYFKNGFYLPSAMVTRIVPLIRVHNDVGWKTISLLKSIIRNGAEMKLSEENENIGYNIGRWFAVLEYIQGKSALSFLSSGMSSPIKLMALNNLALINIKKLPDGRRIYIEKIITSIFSKIEKIPIFLNMLDRAQFMVGRYHQREWLYSTKEQKGINKSEENEEAETVEQ